MPRWELLKVHILKGSPHPGNTEIEFALSKDFKLLFYLQWGRSYTEVGREIQYKYYEGLPTKVQERNTIA